MITIRPIRVADAGSFREALDSVCGERRYLAAFEAPDLNRTVKFVESNVAAGFAQFVAEDEEGRIVGWCDALPDSATSGTAHVGRLGMGVIKDFRGRGIGRRLMEVTIQAAATAGLEKIELSVYSLNTPAIALYEKLGFATEGRKVRGRLVDGVYEDIILMALYLGNSSNAGRGDF